jgi:peptidoglycan hydrolase-like protein with peptidoglycan-binding domain
LTRSSTRGTTELTIDGLYGPKTQKAIEQFQLEMCRNERGTAARQTAAYFKLQKPFDITEQATTVWVWRGGRWQVVADHTSEIKQ